MTADTTLDLALLAERRAGLAALLGTLLLSEPGASVADLVRGVPALAALGTGDPAVAVEYERVFLRGVPLYESGFRSDDGQHGGPDLATVIERYERIGFTEHRDGHRDGHVDAPWRVAGADHLGLELRAFAHLCQEEAAAWRSGTPDESTRAVETERSFLADHLSAWAPVALEAAARVAGGGVYGALVSATADFLAEEHDRLRPAPDVGLALPVAPLPEHLGPARLVRLLLAPATCGTWLSPADIADAARSIGVPWRPSDQRAALRHVIEAAEDDAELIRVLGAIAPVLAAAHDDHRRRAASEPGNAAHSLAWAARAAQMLRLVERIIGAGGLGSAPRCVSEMLVVRGADAGLLADAVDRAVAELQAAGLEVEREVGTRAVV